MEGNPRPRPRPQLGLGLSTFVSVDAARRPTSNPGARTAGMEWNGVDCSAGGSLRGRQWVDDAKRTAASQLLARAYEAWHVSMSTTSCHCCPARRPQRMATDRWTDYRRQDKFRRQLRRESRERDHTALIACSRLMSRCHAATQSTNNSYFAGHYRLVSAAVFRRFCSVLLEDCGRQISRSKMPQ